METFFRKGRQFRHSSNRLSTVSNIPCLEIINRAARKTGTMRGDTAAALSSRQRNPIVWNIRNCRRCSVDRPRPTNSRCSSAQSANWEIINVRRQDVTRSAGQNRCSASSIIFQGRDGGSREARRARRGARLGRTRARNAKNIDIIRRHFHHICKSVLVFHFPTLLHISPVRHFYFTEHRQ